jgi:hypothetical protein
MNGYWEMYHIMLYRVHLTTDKLYHIMLYRVHLNTNKLYHIILYRVHLTTDKMPWIFQYITKSNDGIHIQRSPHSFNLSKRNVMNIQANWGFVLYLKLKFVTFCPMCIKIMICDFLSYQNCDFLSVYHINIDITSY